MKKVLFLCLFLTGCYTPLYMNDPYSPTNPDNIIVRGRFEESGYLGNNISDSNEDIGEVCSNSEQIAYIKDWNIRPLWFIDEQDVVDQARYQAASLGGDGVSIYDLSSFWAIFFNITEAHSIVYKCKSNRSSHTKQLKQTSGYKSQNNKIQQIPASYVY